MSNVTIITITAEDLWDKINQDSDFLKQPKAVREAMRPYVEALPNILADELDSRVTLNSFMKAKLTFLRYCMDNGFIKAVVDAMSEEDLGIFDREDMPEMFEGMLSELVDVAEALIGDVKAFLEAHGITEEQAMLSSTVGFHDEARDLYKSGELTIGKLLTLQPMLIVDNTK